MNYFLRQMHALWLISCTNENESTNTHSHGMLYLWPLNSKPDWSHLILLTETFLEVWDAIMSIHTIYLDSSSF